MEKSRHSEWTALLTSHGRIFNSSKKGEDDSAAGKVELGHRLEDGAGKCYQNIQLFQGQSRTDRMDRIVLEKNFSLYKSHSESLYLPWWISFI